MAWLPVCGTVTSYNGSGPIVGAIIAAQLYNSVSMPAEDGEAVMTAAAGSKFTPDSLRLLRV